MDVYTIGSNRPFLTIHGYYPDHRLMKGCLEPIFAQRQKAQHQTESYKRIYFDLPGMGQTPGPPDVNSSDQMLEVVLDVIEDTIGDENFVLAGESYGGYLARAVVNKMPHRIDGLLLLVPVIHADHDVRKLPEHEVIERDEDLLENMNHRDRHWFEPMHVIQTKRVWERFRDEVLVGVYDADLPWLERLANNAYELSFDIDDMPPFTKPTLILAGKQDSIVGYEDVNHILPVYPNAEFVIIDKAGHDLQIEQPEQFNKHVNAWLDRL